MFKFVTHHLNNIALTYKSTVLVRNEMKIKNTVYLYRHYNILRRQRFIDFVVTSYMRVFP